jgi:glycerol transport system ATP-binding protein
MAIELRNVSLRVGAESHIYETDLSLQAGQFNILLGTTLSGKTTLMRLMAGLEKPTTGELHVNGEDVTGVAVQKRSVAMVYQAFINYPSFSVYDNIASPLRVAGLPRAEIDKKVRLYADLLKLTPMLDRLPSELSGGQQQRTALARALVKGAQLVLATSEPLEALMLGGYTATLSEGRVVQFGKTSTIYRQPENLESARVFSDPPINIAVIEKRGARAHLNETVNWRIPAKLAEMPDGKYKIGLKAHHLSPANGEVEVRGEVQIAEISGSESIIRVNIEGNQWVSEAHGIHGYDFGQKASFFFDAERCFYFDSNEQIIDSGG